MPNILCHRKLLAGSTFPIFLSMLKPSVHLSILQYHPQLLIECIHHGLSSSWVRQQKAMHEHIPAMSEQSLAAGLRHGLSLQNGKTFFQKRQESSDVYSANFALGQKMTRVKPRVSQLPVPMCRTAAQSVHLQSVQRIQLSQGQDLGHHNIKRT